MSGARPERGGFLGLGSNQGDREAHLRAAVAMLERRGVAIEAVSSVYETEPVGDYEGEQPHFLNAVARVRTALEPEQLLATCKAIERERGRDPAGPRHGPRPLDLDILLLGELELRSERLSIPHPALRERRFVLEPLLELDPDASLPNGERLAGDLDELPAAGVRRRGSLSR